MKRRSFLKMVGEAVTALIALAKPSPEAKGKITPNIEPETGVKKDEVAGQPFYVRNKVCAVSKKEKIYLDYYKIEQTTQKPLIRIIGWPGNLKYVFLPLEEINYSDKPLPRHYVEFESEQPLETGDLIELEDWRWDCVGRKEYIIVQVQPLFETFEYGQTKA